MDGVCSGLKVVDFSWGMAGPLVGMVLCDFGADVVKVEPPGGDPFRRMPGAVQWHRGKKSAVLNLKEPEGREVAQYLAAASDVVIESFRPGVVDRLGIGYAQVSPTNPRLVHCSISGFGQQGPWSAIKGYEAVVLARGGFMAGKMGWRSPGPIFHVLMQASVGAAHFALQGIFGALRLRRQTGRGCRVETSLLQGAINYQFAGTYRWKDASRLSGESTATNLRDPLGDIAGYRICRCKDGRWLQLGNYQSDLFHRMLDAIGMEEESRDPKYRKAPQFESEEDRRLFIRRIEEQIALRPFAEWARLFDERDVAYAPHLTTQEFMDDAQVKHLGLAVPVKDSALGETQQVGPLFHLRGGGWSVQGGAPRVGEHTREVVSSLPKAPPPGPAPGDHSPSSMVLEGIRVVDASIYVAAPSGVAYLADYGASIIKVEPPGGDPQRRWGDVWVRPSRGKRSIGIDLKRPEGQEALHRLVQQADVFVHNYRPGVGERLRIDSETLRAINPRLVYCHATSYGSSGPYAGRAAFDPVVSALTGGTTAQAGRGNPPQTHNTSDMGAGLALATALMMALYQRDRTGEGQELETQMLAAAAYLHSDDFIRFPGRSPRMLADQGQHGPHALYRLYEAAEGWALLAVATDKEWEAFCRTAGVPQWLGDPRFATAEARRAHDAELTAELGRLLRTRSAPAWERTLTAADVACVCAHEAYAALVFDHEHYRQNVGAVVGCHPQWGEYQQPGPLVRLSGVPCAGSLRSWNLGDNTDEVLREAGYSTEQVRQLRQEGIVF